MPNVIVPQEYSSPNGRPPVALDSYVIPAGAGAGTVVANILNVPSGLTPSVEPSDYFTVLGSEASGYKVVISTAVPSGPVTLRLGLSTQRIQYAMTSPVAVVALFRLTPATPLKYNVAANTTIPRTSGSTVTGIPSGITLNNTAITGTPSVRSFLLNEKLSGVSLNTLVFAPEATPRTMKLGMGMAGLARYTENNVWLDHLKPSSIDTYPGSMDANGMPLTLGADGNGQPRVTYQVPMPDGRTTPVKFRVITDGDMDFFMATSNGNGFQGAFTKEGSDWVLTYAGSPCYAPSVVCYFMITAIRTAPTKMALVRDDEAARFRAGNTFRPKVIAALQGFQHVRMMNWSDANMTDPCPTPDEYITYSSQDGGNGAPAAHVNRIVPLKYQTRLCIEANVGGWFNEHIKITDAQSQARWTYYDQLKAKGLSVRIELSNEIWNGQFVQYTTATNAANALGYNQNPNNNTFFACVWYNGYRTSQLAKNARGRGYKWIVGCQPSAQYQAQTVLDGIAAASGVKTDISIWSTANYMSGTLPQAQADIGATQYALQAGWVAAGDYDAMFDNVLNYLGPATNSVLQLKGYLEQAVSFATTNGWTCEAYEGGSLHLNSNFGGMAHPSLDAFYYSMTDNALFKPAMTVNLETSQAAGLKASTVFDFDSRPADCNFGRFGLYGTPGFDALTDWLAAGGAADAVVPPVSNYRRVRVTPWGAQNNPGTDTNVTPSRPGWQDSSGNLTSGYRFGTAEVILSTGGTAVSTANATATTQSSTGGNVVSRVVDGATNNSYITEPNSAVSGGQFIVDYGSSASIKPDSVRIYICQEAIELSGNGFKIELDRNDGNWVTVADTKRTAYSNNMYADIALTYPA